MKNIKAKPNKNCLLFVVRYVKQTGKWWSSSNKAKWLTRLFG